MIKITVDMWPGGSSRDKYELFSMTLSNMGGDDNKGDYLVRLFRRPIKGTQTNVRREAPHRTGEVIGHPRKRVHVAYLIAKAIRSVYPKATGE